MQKIVNNLFNYQDLKFKEFNSQLLPNIEKSTIIGVKIPNIRLLAKEFIKDNDYSLFMNELPHKYLEENLLHGILISMNNNLDDVLNQLNDFLPYVNNWEVCDVIKPKVFKTDLKKVYEFLKIWIKSNENYRIRFAVVTLLNFYLDEEFNNGINNLVLNIKNDDYYVQMSISWYFSFALIKHWNETIHIFENRKLNKFIHNNSIQKAVESYRISNDKKKYLKKLKIV